MAKKLRIEYQVVPDAVTLAARAAEQFTQAAEKAACERGRARIAISGGSTPKAAFALMADAGQPWRSRMPWDKLELFWVDERCVPPEDAESNYRMTREALLDKVPLKPEQIHRMEGELEPQKSCCPLRIAAPQQLSPGRRREPPLRPGRTWAWVPTATPLPSSPIPTRSTKWAGSSPPTTSPKKILGASPSPGP